MVDSISRIASALESARAVTLEAAAVASSKLGETSYMHYSKGITPEQLSTLLNSRNSREIKDGMKRIMAIMSSGDSSINAESYFADVVKNVISDDVKIKTLVCIYLMRYAEKNPNLALLSVNSLQKTLTHGDPDVRALSIKGLSDIRIPSLYPIVLHTLKKVVSDSSPIVRNEVAFALLKLYVAKTENIEEDTIQVLNDLLSDSDPMVLSAAILVVKECFPNRLELLHGHFRYYCKIITELDSWSISYLVNLLLVYCKTYLPRPILVDSSTNLESQETMELPERFNEIRFPVYDIINDDDLTLFLDSLEKLVTNSNPAVVLAASKAFFQLGTPRQFKKSRFPEVLVRVCSLSANTGVLNMFYQSILLFSSVDSTLFLPFMKKFFILPSNDTIIASLKIKILSTMVNESNVKIIVKELKHYIARAYSSTISITAANALAACAQLSAGWESNIMKWLISHIEKSKISTAVLSSFINVIRVLAQENPKRHLAQIMKLSGILENRNSLADNARAALVWLFGELASVEYKICPDILRKLLPNFAYEGPETRSQILLLAAKLVSYNLSENENITNVNSSDFDKSRIMEMYKAVLYLAEFDAEFDIRDRARTISSLFDSGKYEIAALLLQAPKPTPKMELLYRAFPDSTRSVETEYATLGLDKSVRDYHKCDPWKNEKTVTLTNTREPAPLKDYSKFQKSFSSDTFVARSISDQETSLTNPDKNTGIVTASSQQGKKYRLQSLDEFFMDVPTMPTKKSTRRIVIEETSDEEESSTEGEESGTDDESDSDDESSTYDESDDSGISDSSDPNDSRIGGDHT